MTIEVKRHETLMSLAAAAPAEVYAGAEMTVQIRLECSAHCSLLGNCVKIVDAHGTVVREMALIAYDETANTTGEIAIQSPVEVGEYTWTALFAEQGNDELVHGESAAPFSFVVKPHALSMAIWDVPSPIGYGAEFTAKVGIRCSAGCKLAESPIRIHDHQDTQVAAGRLGNTPWSATSLYWTEVHLQAPLTPGVYNWTVKFPSPELVLPHAGIVDTFAFGTARQPEHLVSVQVIDKASRAPLKYALVTLGAEGAFYRDRTDDSGVARLTVPHGQFTLYVSTSNYLEFEMTTDIAGDTTVQAELTYAPEDWG